MIDLAFFGRALARRPILVRSSKQIEHEARRGWLIFVGKVAAIAVGFIVVVSAIFLATP